jgi:hypothetical protein
MLSASARERFESTERRRYLVVDTMYKLGLRRFVDDATPI